MSVKGQTVVAWQYQDSSSYPSPETTFQQHNGLDSKWFSCLDLNLEKTSFHNPSSALRPTVITLHTVDY